MTFQKTSWQLSSANLQLCFREFFYRLCCPASAETLSIKEEFDEAKKVDHDFLKNLLQRHKEADIEAREAKKEYDEAQKKFEAAKKKKQLKENNQEKLEDQIAVYFARTVSMITEGSFNIVFFSLGFLGKTKDEDRRLFCSICFEKYNDSNRQQCVLHCGHSTCKWCLDKLAAKTCPACRKPFTDENIIMMFQH